MSGDNGHIGQRTVDEEFLDSVVDAVAREMTEGEPSGAMRARVLARIEEERRTPAQPAPRWAWAGAAAAVALAIAAAVWVVNPARTPGEVQGTIASQRPAGTLPAAGAFPRPASKPAALSPGTAAPAGAAPSGRGSGAALVRRARADAADRQEDRHPVPALADIEPLAFSTVDPEPLQIAGVTVTPFPAMPSIDIPGFSPDPNDIPSSDSKKEK